MTSRSLASLLAVVFIYGLFSTTDARDLVFVQALWRHGDRAPLSMPYPNDPYNETAWIRGWKQLTNIGMQQLSELGTYFRKKYGFFISSQYIPSEVYIRASDSDRSLTSAQSFLFGFYPAAGAYQWQTNNPWQPIPIHATTPDEPDLLIKPTATKCEKYDDEVQKEDEAQAVVYNAKYAEMFQFLGNATGIANFSYPNVNKVYDIQRELNNGMTAKQPAWVFKNWTQYDNRSTMDIITELRTYRMITQFNSTEKAKMIAGYLLNNWIQNANQVTNGTMTSPKKMLLYSSHDGTVQALMYALGIGNDLMVPYAAALIMEIYKDADNYVVEVFYRNDTSKDPYPMALPGCGTPCTVANMTDLYSNVRLDSYASQQALCGTPVPECKSSTTVSYLLGIVLFIAIAAS